MEDKNLTPPKAEETEDKTKEIIEKIKQAKENKNFAFAGEQAIKLAEHFFNKENYNDAKILFLEAQKCFQLVRDKKMEAKCFFELGYMNMQTDNYHAALNFFKNALEIYISTHYGYDHIGDCYLHIGRCYRNIFDFENALEYFKKSLLYFKKSENVVKIGVCYNELAVVYSYTGKYDEAIEHHKTASSLLFEYLLSEEDDSNIKNDVALFEISQCHLSFAFTYFLMRNYEEAKDLLIKAEETLKDIKNFGKKEDKLYKDIQRMMKVVQLYIL